MTIYTSTWLSVPIVSRSLYTHLFSHPHDPSSPAFTDAHSGRTISRGELRSLSLQTAHGLRTQLHVKRGDTVLIFSPNSLAWPVVLLGVIAAGGRATLANSAYTPSELAFQYSDSRARVVFVHPDLVGVALKMFESIGVSEDEARRRIVIMTPVIEGGKGRKDGLKVLEELLGKGEIEREERFDGDVANETVLLCYSSGTTGKPKGVETTHRNLTAMLSMLEVVKAVSPDKDVMIATLPYYHIYGVVKLLFYEIFLGVSTVILPKFSPDDFCAAIERYKVTTAFIVPPIILALVHHPAVDKYNIKSLIYISSGAAPLSGDLVSAFRRRLGEHIAVGQGYGLTETSPVTHIVPRRTAQSSTQKIGSVGKLMPNLQARLVTDADEDAKPGEAGEVWVRGPTIMKGYLNRPDATANSITKEGWFKTGDIGVVDEDGYYAIVDRKKELIKYKGFQVPPAELEGVLLQHPDIVDAAVIGVEDPAQATELPRAYVVHKSGRTNAPISFPNDVQRWIEGRVARHKFLRGGVVVVDVIPKSAAGKILRRELRDRAKGEVRKVKAKL